MLTVYVGVFAANAVFTAKSADGVYTQALEATGKYRGADPTRATGYGVIAGYNNQLQEMSHNVAFRIRFRGQVAVSWAHRAGAEVAPCATCGRLSDGRLTFQAATLAPLSHRG
eukprot:COSAG01_NODE_520_length_16006_cov_6.454077_6_plen_113_part_00